MPGIITSKVITDGKEGGRLFPVRFCHWMPFPTRNPALVNDRDTVENAFLVIDDQERVPGHSHQTPPVPR
ncbi:MAG: hypothetical protein R3F31_05235 [Verrucomicrobiales bacterium]